MSDSQAIDGPNPEGYDSVEEKRRAEALHARQYGKTAMRCASDAFRRREESWKSCVMLRVTRNVLTTKWEDIQDENVRDFLDTDSEDRHPILLFRHPSGECDTVSWPLTQPEHLRSALYDAREQGLIPDVGSVRLPDGSWFMIDLPKGSDWTSEAPTEVGTYWFYGEAHRGSLGCHFWSAEQRREDPFKPRLQMVEVVQLRNGIAACTKGGFMSLHRFDRARRAEGHYGYWKKFDLPAPPDDPEGIFAQLEKD